MSNNVVIGAGLAVLFGFLAWWRWRRLTRGTGALVLRLILFGAAFILGEVYLVVWITDLKWPRIVAFIAIASWGALLLSRVGSRAFRPREGAAVQVKK